MPKTIYASEYWAYQMRMCRVSPRPILNIGSNEDPAHLGHLFGATNLDVIAEDPATHQDLYRVPRFVQATALALPFSPESFGAAVLGEVLEHCKPDAALAILQQARQALKPGGWLIATIPFDTRSPQEQHEGQELWFLQGGYTDEITYWHQTTWSEESLRPLMAEAGLSWHSSRKLPYPMCDCSGMGILAKKEVSNDRANPVG